MNKDYDVAKEVIANSICEIMELCDLNLTIEDKFDILDVAIKLQNIVKRIRNRGI